MSKIKFNQFKENMVTTLELPKDLMYEAVIITATGQQEILVENYRGILEYTPESIKIQTKTCCVCISGKRLNIAYYTNEEMKICGFIKSIFYE